VLAKAEKVHEHQQLSLPLGNDIGFLMHEQLAIISPSFSIAAIG
jgi:hypothetical protein